MNYTKEELLKKGFTEPIYCKYYSYWHNRWFESGCFTTKYLPVSFRKIEGKECVIVEFPSNAKYAIPVSELERLGILKKEETVRITSLKEEYIVICKTYAESNQVHNFITNRTSTCFYKYVINSIQVTSKLWGCIPGNLKYLPILTFSEWKQLKDKEMENKKIIGYKAPYEIFDGVVKKGDIFFSNDHGYYYAYKNNKKILGEAKHDIGIPEEIVETWEPVYESIELPVICNRKGVFDREELTVTYGEFKFSVSYLSELKNLFTSDTAMIESWIFNHTSSFRITKKELEEIFKYLDAQ